MTLGNATQHFAEKFNSIRFYLSVVLSLSKHILYLAGIPFDKLRATILRIQSEPVGFNNRIGKEFFAHFFYSGFCFFSGNALHAHLQILAHLNPRNFIVPQIFERMMHSLALRVQNAVFECNVNFCEHFRANYHRT